MSQAPPKTDRLAFAPLTEADAPDLADILSDPEVARGIMAKATTPDQCLACARARIDWHNAGWEAPGIGVWGLRLRDAEATGLIGWCGLTPSGHGGHPEILYGLKRTHWGRGLAHQAAQATVSWALDNGICDGIDALIFGRLNPGSVAVAERIGMERTGRISMSDFLSDADLGRDVLDYEAWRVSEGAFIDFTAMLEQAAFKSGMLASTGIAAPDAVLSRLKSAALSRRERPAPPQTEVIRTIDAAFEDGMAAPFLDVFRIERQKT